MSGVGLLSDYSDPEDPHSMSLAAVNSDPSGNKADIENRFLLEDTEKSWIQRLSNQTVLGITCALFFIFVVAEVIGALASNSLSLLGDAAAMSVDVFTYLTNMYAERLKSQGRTMDRQTRFILEVYVPTFSICALLGVTGWITSDAIKVILDGGDDDDVDVMMMFGFAAGNFFVDAVSTWMFWMRGKDVLVTERVSFSIDHHSDLHSVPKKTNLNMVSALTHVGSDTMRTTSVFVAAVIATASSASSSLCDAWAAVVVSITIVCAVIPLLIEIYKAATK